MEYGKILIIILLSTLLTGCTSSIQIKSFSVGTNSRGMLEGDFDLVDIDTTTKITDEVDTDTEAENSLIDNSSNSGASFEDDEDANNFYNQPTSNKSKEPLDDDKNSNSNSKSKNNSNKSANVNSYNSEVVPQVK